MSWNTTQPIVMPLGSFDDRGPGLRIFIIVLILIMIISVSLRFWSRALTKVGAGRTPRFWWDDWLALLALPPLLTAASLLLDMVRLGMGRHMRVIPPENIMPLLKRLFAVYYCYNAGLTLAKASCLLFYSRVFGAPSTSKWFPRTIYATHALNFGVWIGGVRLTSFNYNPRAQMSPGYRPSTVSMWLSSAIPGVTIDLILLVLPLPIIWKLRIKRSRKFVVLGVFICGYCVVFVSLGRLISIVKSDELDKDLTHASVPSIYWQAAEGPMTLLCVCLPSMPALWRRAASVAKGRFFRNTSGGNSYPPDSQGSTNPMKQPALGSQPAFDAEMNTFMGDDSHDNHSQHGSESMILSPPTTHHSYATNVPKPTNALLRDAEPCDHNIYVQKDIYVSRSTS